MTVLKAHYDGKVLVPDEPVDLPVNCALEVQVKTLEAKDSSQGPAPQGSAVSDKPLLRLAQLLEELPDNPNWPADGAAQHDHYLYGTAKRR
ncbi:MAG: hypothetical protein HYY23_02775 [Verrucomicrobia bacterium]|nr:hypothetical protein [Verrucomicrobiota bacterium]